MEDGEHPCDCLYPLAKTLWENLYIGVFEVQASKPSHRFKKDDDLNKALHVYSFVSLVNSPQLGGVSNRRAASTPAASEVQPHVPLFATSRVDGGLAPQAACSSHAILPQACSSPRLEPREAAITPSDLVHHHHHHHHHHRGVGMALAPGGGYAAHGTVVGQPVPMHASQLQPVPLLQPRLECAFAGLSSTGEPSCNIREIPFSELQLQQVIGEGGFGKVYRALWNGATVAVKVLAGDMSQRGAVVREFRRECETMSCLAPHQHVLRLLGACTAGAPLALVTEFCSRGSLYALLHSPTVQLSWSQILAMCLGVALGMRHLHEHKVLHRDLKSGNLLVDENLFVKIADFGLSRIMQDFQTLTGGLGTYQWMAPEVLANSCYSEKADVYSFGIVLWECAARQVPYAGLNGMQAAMGVMNRGLRPEVPNYTPPSLGNLMRRCWAAVPKDRPSFTDIAEELKVMYKDMQMVQERAPGLLSGVQS